MAVMETGTSGDLEPELGGIVEGKEGGIIVLLQYETLIVAF